MRLFCFFLFLLFSFPVFGQSWVKYFDGTSWARDIQRTAQGYWIHANPDAVEITPQGQATGWIQGTFAQAFYLTLRRQDPKSILADKIALYTTAFDGTYFWLVQKPDGSTKESAPYKDTRVYFVKPGNDSTFYVMGASWLRCFRLDFRSEWQVLWEAPFSGNNTGDMAAWAGGAVIGNAGKITCFDTLGNRQWELSGTFTSLRDVVVSKDSIYTIYTDPATSRTTLFQLDSRTGAQIRSVALPVNNISVFALLDNGDIATGSIGNGATSTVLTRMNAAGKIKWQNQYAARLPFALLAESDGSTVMTCVGNSSRGVYVMRIDANGVTPARTPLISGERVMETADMRLMASPTANIINPSQTYFMQMPKSQSTSTIYLIAPWLAGTAPDGGAHVRAINYEGPSNALFQPGYYGAYPSDFRRVWLVRQDEIDQLRRDFALDGQVNGPVPQDILTWPARNNTLYRENLALDVVRTPAERFSAPFTDVNADGRYNPYDGDFPTIKGDQMAWWIMSDSLFLDNPDWKPLGVEIAFSLYTLHCAGSELGNQTFFLDYLIRHIGQIPYTDAYIGQWTDFDIGCPSDDYAGSLPGVHGFYTYNTDPIDGNPNSGCAPANNFPSDSIPLQAGVWLNTSADRVSVFNNNSTGVPPPATTDPSLPSEFYGALRGFWKDGKPFVAGGNGYEGTFPSTTHLFPGNPANAGEWSMCSAGLPIGDRRILASHGPFDFRPGDVLLLSSAFVYQRGIALPCPDVRTSVEPVLRSMRDLYASGALLAKSRLEPVVTLPTAGPAILDATLAGALGYQWSNGASAAVITVAQAGTYTVTITRASGCPQIAETLVRMPVSAQSVPEAPVWALSPNPAQDFLALACPACTEGLEIVIFSSQGVPVRRFESSVASAHVRLDVADLPAGLYWVTLRHGDRQAGMRRVVIQRRN